VPYLTLSCDDFEWYDGYKNVSWFRNEFTTPPTLTFKLTQSSWHDSVYYGTYEYVDQFPVINSITGDFDLVVGGFQVIYNMLNYIFKPIIAYDKLGKSYITFGAIAVAGNSITKAYSTRTIATLTPTTGTCYDTSQRYFLTNWDTTSVTFDVNNINLTIPIDTYGEFLNQYCFSCTNTINAVKPVNINMKADIQATILIGATPPILDPTIALSANFNYKQSPGITTTSPPAVVPSSLPPGYAFTFAPQTRVSFYGKYPDIKFNLIETNSTQTIAKYTYISYSSKHLVVGGFTVTHTPYVSFRITPLEVNVPQLNKSFLCYGIYDQTYDNNGTLTDVKNIYFKPSGGAGGTFGDQDWRDNNFSTLTAWYRDEPTDGNLFNANCYGPKCGKTPPETASFVTTSTAITSQPATALAPIQHFYGTGQDASGQPLATGSTDTHYKISKVAITETKPTHYWKFNNSLKDEFSALTFTTANTNYEYTTGIVINSASSSTAVRPTTYVGNFYQDFFSLTNNTLFSGDWAITGWIKVPPSTSMPSLLTPISFSNNQSSLDYKFFDITYAYNSGSGHTATHFNFEIGGNLGAQYSYDINTPVFANSFAFFVIKNEQGILKASINGSAFVAVVVDNFYNLNYNPNSTLYNTIKISTSVDDLRIYNTALADAEIQFIYNKSEVTQYVPAPNTYIQGTGTPREYNTPYITPNSALTVQDTTKWPLAKSTYYADSWWPSQNSNELAVYNNNKAKWVAFSSDCSTLSNRLTTGTYTIATTINLYGYVFDTVEIEMSISADDVIYDVLINGRSTGLNNIDNTIGVSATGSQYSAPRFYNIWNFTLPSGKNHLWNYNNNSVNTIEFVIAAKSTNIAHNPFGSHAATTKAAGVQSPQSVYYDLNFRWDQKTVLPPTPPVPPTPPPLPIPDLTTQDYLSRSSDCILLDSFTYNALGPIKNKDYITTSPVLPFVNTTTPTTYGQNITGFGFAISGTKWIRNQSDPTNACGFRRNCDVNEKNYPFGTMAKNTTIYRTINIPADSWITLQFRQTTPPPRYQYVNDTSAVVITIKAPSANNTTYSRTIIDTQSLIGKPTKRIMPPLFGAVREYGSKNIDVTIEIKSAALIFEHYIDDIVIEYGPGYCDQLHCIDTFTGNDDNQKYLNTVKSYWVSRGPAEINFGSKYYIPAGKTATRTIRLGGYLNKGAKVSVVVSGYCDTNTNGIITILETFDENLQPLEAFADRLRVTHPGSMLSSNDFDNGSAVDSYTSSTFVIGQACKIIKVLVTSNISDFHIGFIDVCSDQDITVEKIEPLVNCKGNVTKLKANISINGVPREEVNIFQAFAKYSILTNTHYRTGTTLAIPPVFDGRVGTTLPTSCADSKLCNYWKQQGTSDGPVQSVLAHAITDNGINTNLLNIVNGSYNNLRTIDNYIWASPLIQGFAPDQYIIDFGTTPSNLAEDNFVDIVEIYLSVNRAAVANTTCSLYGSNYKFARYITFNANEPLLNINIPAINFQDPQILDFELVSSTKSGGITTATYALRTHACADNTVLLGGFAIEFHPEDGEYFLIKTYDWSKSPNDLFGTHDTCRNNVDYATFTSIGALGSLNYNSVYDSTLTVIDIKPDAVSIAPVDKRYWVKRINQSSTMDLFSQTSSGNNIPITFLKTVTGTGTNTFNYNYDDVVGTLEWHDVEVSTSGTSLFLGSCPDPAESLTVTIEYIDNLGQFKSFNQDILLSDIYMIDGVNTEDWNKLSAYGNGLKGDFGMWIKTKFVLDDIYGTGLDQCLPIPIPTEFGGDTRNNFSNFQNIAKGANLGFCQPNISVFEVIPGAHNNEIQSVVIPAASDGFFKISFDYLGNYSAEVPYNVDADGFRASLASLGNIGSTDNVTVTGLGTQKSPFLIEFVGQLSLTALPLLSIDTTNLKCIATGSVTILTSGSNKERQKLTKTTDTRAPLILSYDNFVTGSIPYNASMNTMQAAIALLPPLGNNVTVSGDIVDSNSDYTGPWYVDFGGDLAGQAMQPLTPIVSGYAQELLWSGVTGVNTKQSISISASTGSYTLTIVDNVNGASFTATTDQISLDATAEDIANAIVSTINFLALSDISIKIVSTTSSGVEWTIEFIGNYGRVVVPKIVLDTTRLYKSAPAVIIRTQSGLGVHERQRLGISQVTSGYYYLSITIGDITETTEEIAYDASDVALETAISGLSFFSAGDAVVRHDPLQEGEFRAYTISFSDKFGDVPAIKPIFEAYLICNPAILIAGPPYDYIVPVCKPNALALTNADLICKPGPNDGVTPLPVDCCTIAKTGDNVVDLIELQRELFSPKTKINGSVVTIKQLAASRNISSSDFNVYIRDFRTNTIKASNWDAQIISGISLLFIENDVDTAAGQRDIIHRLKTSQELLPTRMQLTVKNQSTILGRNNLYE
jgi:hypothetical protein